MLASWVCKTLGPGERQQSASFLNAPDLCCCRLRITCQSQLVVEGNDTLLAAVPMGPDVRFRSYVSDPTEVLSHVPPLRATLNARVHHGLRNDEATHDSCTVPVPDCGSLPGIGASWGRGHGAGGPQVCGIPNHYFIQGFCVSGPEVSNSAPLGPSLGSPPQWIVPCNFKASQMPDCSRQVEPVCPEHVHGLEQCISGAASCFLSSSPAPAPAPRGDPGLCSPPPPLCPRARHCHRPGLGQLQQFRGFQIAQTRVVCPMASIISSSGGPYTSHFGARTSKWGLRPGPGARGCRSTSES